MIYFSSFFGRKDQVLAIFFKLRPLIFAIICITFRTSFAVNFGASSQNPHLITRRGDDQKRVEKQNGRRVPFRRIRSSWLAVLVSYWTFKIVYVVILRCVQNRKKKKNQVWTGVPFFSLFFSFFWNRRRLSHHIIRLHHAATFDFRFCRPSPPAISRYWWIDSVEGGAAIKACGLTASRSV